MENETEVLSNTSDTLNAVLADARKYATAQGQGANARANLLVRVVRGAALGALDTIKRDAKGNEDKKGRDHADLIYDAYITTCSAKNVHGAKTIVSKTSNIRKAITLGQRNDIDAIAVMNRTQAIYKELNTGADDAIPLHPPFEAFNMVVRRQMEKKGAELSDDEIKDAIMKGEGKEKDALAHVKAALAAMEKAYKLAPENEKIVEALDAVNHAMAWLTQENEQVEKLAQWYKLQAEFGGSVLIPAQQAAE